MAIQTCYEQEYRQNYNFEKRGTIGVSFDADARTQVCDISDSSEQILEQYPNFQKNLSPGEITFYVIIIFVAFIQLLLVFRYFARLQLYFNRLQESMRTEGLNLAQAVDEVAVDQSELILKSSTDTKTTDIIRAGTLTSEGEVIQRSVSVNFDGGKVEKAKN